MADALDSKPSARKGVRVQVPLLAPIFIQDFIYDSKYFKLFQIQN